MRTASPTSTHSMSVCSETSATPCTTAMGACCPPIASTAIAGIYAEHTRQGFGGSSRPAAAEPLAPAPQRRAPSLGAQAPAQVGCRDAVLESLASLDQPHRHLVGVTPAQVGIGVDVADLDLDRQLPGYRGDHGRHLVAQVAIVAGDQGE